jgi:holo-[acyl-carrier protein] synthase
MIAGVGIDIVDIDGFREQLSDPATTFVQGVFTGGELSDVETRPARDKTPHLAARYAAKEAFIKAWSASNSGRQPVLKSVDLREIEVKTDPHGRPTLALHGDVQTSFEQDRLGSFHLSISHDGGTAAAFVIIESNNQPLDQQG